MSAIARLLQESGFKVSGSDRAESPYTRDLAAAGVTIHIGHQAGNVQGADLVVRSSAIADDNIEVSAARSAGIAVLKRAEYLGSLMEGRTGIAVAGTHGKTTTTAMLAWVLTALGQDPAFICGGTLTNLGVNARAGKGAVFVIEADEYDRMFLGLKPSLAIVTNVEHDHPDCYPTPEDFHRAFVEFVHLLPPTGTLVTCVEDAGARRLLHAAKKAGKAVVAYSLSPVVEDSNIEVNTFTEVLNPGTDGAFTFEARVMGDPVTVSLQVPGRHNVSNALGVLSVIRLLGLDLAEAGNALGEFRGAGRRFELRGEVDGVTVIDDYAHHPTEIRATLAAARLRFPDRRIWAVWQPHTYSRTRTLMREFTQAFQEADEVLVTEVFASREAEQNFSSRQVVSAMAHRSAHYTGGLENTRNILISLLHPGDVVLILSAGDADQISTRLLAHLKGG